DLRDGGDVAGVLVAMAAPGSWARHRMALRLLPVRRRFGAVPGGIRTSEGRQTAGIVYAGTGDQRDADDRRRSIAVRVAQAGGTADASGITSPEGDCSPRSRVMAWDAAPTPPRRSRARVTLPASPAIRRSGRFRIPAAAVPLR